MPSLKLVNHNGPQLQTWQFLSRQFKILHVQTKIQLTMNIFKEMRYFLVKSELVWLKFF